MRGQLATDLARNGVAPAMTQKIMRHSDYKMTSKYYTHFLIGDTQKAIGKLPDYDDFSDIQQNEKTGTDDLVLSEIDDTKNDTGNDTYNQKNTEKTRNFAAEKLKFLESMKSAVSKENSLERLSQGCLMWSEREDLNLRPLDPQSKLESVQPAKAKEVMKERESNDTENDTSFCQRHLDLPLEIIEIIKSWDTLPEALKTGILAMVRSAKKEN